MEVGEYKNKGGLCCVELFAAAKTVVFCTKKVVPLLTFERGEEEGNS